MKYKVIVYLPHHTLGGELIFLDEPKLGELVEFLPLAIFKITEVFKERHKIIFSFSEIHHCVDVIKIATAQMGFEVVNFQNMTHYL